MKQTIVWTKPGCPSCVQAKSFLMSQNIPFQERVIGTKWTREQLFEQMPDQYHRYSCMGNMWIGWK